MHLAESRDRLLVMLLQQHHKNHCTGPHSKRRDEPIAPLPRRYALAVRLVDSDASAICGSDKHNGNDNDGAGDSAALHAMRERHPFADAVDRGYAKLSRVVEPHDRRFVTSGHCPRYACGALDSPECPGV